ncbi:DNA polymerase, beta domain protein region [Candidatus Scalindua japonica]|uniref:DNA polymerase, beta domain protein region n=1 Tax=Candidatus Scalindua japonica TaxID=1284222 RepID=A0A286TVB2_9BACT|nr:nucleotidyltransferase domain-containing protein [Candidatus Scalindua japonica]GAX59775.1 DNA polymerase, beta domain protein region [Candidatus Scalindua japonica]
MIKYKKLPENINELLPKARVYLNDHPNVSFAYFFGGYSKDTSSPMSDIDIAVYLSEVPDLLQVKTDLLGELIEILETDEIDLVILNTSSLPLVARIIEMKETIVDKDPLFRQDYESLKLREYFDFSIKEIKILKERYLLDRQSPYTEKVQRAG